MYLNEEELLGKFKELKNATKPRNELLYARKINNRELHIKDFRTNYEKSKQMDNNFTSDNVDDYCLSVNQVLNNMDSIKATYSKMFAPMYKRGILIFQFVSLEGLIYCNDKTKLLHNNFFKNDTFEKEKIYINEIIRY